MTLGSRVAVMRDGTIQQVDTPQTLYREPVNLFVAAFIGSPSMNLVEARVDGDAVEFAGFRIPLDADRVPARLETGDGHPRHPAAGLRGRRAPPTRRCRGSRSTSMVVEELGSATHVLFTIDAPPVDVDSVRAASDDGERATLLATDRRALFTAEVAEEAERAARATGSRLALDPARLHFFDPETGASLRAGAVEPAAAG